MGSFMSVIVHSVHNSIVPHIATPCSLSSCDFRPWLTMLFPAWLSCAMLSCHVCRRQARACLSKGWALNRCFAWTFGTSHACARGGVQILRGLQVLATGKHQAGVQCEKTESWPGWLGFHSTFHGRYFWIMQKPQQWWQATGMASGADGFQKQSQMGEKCLFWTVLGVRELCGGCSEDWDPS